MTESRKTEALAAATRLAEWSAKRKYKGFDPYDGLNSLFAPLLTLGTQWGRIFLIQFMRRSPINLRRVLCVKPGENPKGLGLFLEGYARLYRANPTPELKIEADYLVERLAELRSPGISGSGWGYDFPWQNRWQCLPRYTPTIVNSAFIGHALLDWYEASGNEKARDLARSIPEFMRRDLNRMEEDGVFCFSYTPLDRNFVHNASMIGASLIARVGLLTGDDAAVNAAKNSLAYSMKYQRADGSWPYAETEYQSWIDSFHTGFNLEALRWFIKLGVAEPEYIQAYKRGVKFYADNFFLPDGTPKYYHDREYLVDIHAPAEAVSFFAEEEGYEELAARELEYLLTHMRDPKNGLFYFRRKGKKIIAIPYMRWSQAWAFRALCRAL